MDLFGSGLMVFVLSFAVALGAGALILKREDREQFKRWIAERDVTGWRVGSSDFSIIYLIGIASRILMVVGVVLMLPAIF